MGKPLRKSIGGVVLLGLGACSSPPPEAKFTRVEPDNVVNVSTELEVSAREFGEAAIIDAVQSALTDLSIDIRDGRVKPGKSVQWVQALVFVKTPDNPRQKLGSLRFPVQDFVARTGDLNAADMVQFREYGAAREYCTSPVHQTENFCVRAAADAT